MAFLAAFSLWTKEKKRRKKRNLRKLRGSTAKPYFPNEVLLVSPFLSRKGQLVKKPFDKLHQAVSKGWQKPFSPFRSCTKVLRENGKTANLRHLFKRNGALQRHFYLPEYSHIIRRKWSATFFDSLPFSFKKRGQSFTPSSVVARSATAPAPER